MRTPRKLYWVGSICEHVELVGDEAEYAVGDCEPCVHCPYPKCVATVGHVETERTGTPGKGGER